MNTETIAPPLSHQFHLAPTETTLVTPELDHLRSSFQDSMDAVILAFDVLPVNEALFLDAVDQLAQWWRLNVLLHPDEKTKTAFVNSLTKWYEWWDDILVAYEIAAKKMLGEDEMLSKEQSSVIFLLSMVRFRWAGIMKARLDFHNELPILRKHPSLI